MGCVCSTPSAAEPPAPAPVAPAAQEDVQLQYMRTLTADGSAVSPRVSSRTLGQDAQYEDVDLLVSIPFFDELDARRLKELRSIFQRQVYEANETIVEEGKAASQFYVIVSGKVGLSARTPQDQKVVELSVLNNGQWFGELALTKDAILPVTAKALEKCIILRMGVEQYEKLVEQHPELRVSVTSFGRRAPIKVSLKNIPFFQDVPDIKLQLLAALVEFRKCKAGEVLCRQNDEADGFYYLVEGRCDVSAMGAGQEQVHLDTISAGAWFGEIALLEHTRRTATIVSSSPCVLLYLTRERFNRFLLFAPEVHASGVFQRLVTKRTANSLKAIPLFSLFKRKDKGPLQQFDEQKLALLGELFKWVNFEAGNVVFKEGDEADSFYIIVSGECEMVATAPDGKPVVFGQSRQNDWFGELALLRNGAPRSVTVKCLTPCVMLKLMEVNFHKFLTVSPDFEQFFQSRLNVRTADRLRNMPFFAGIKENRPWSKLDMLGGLFTFQERAAGDIIFEEGAPGDNFYVIVDGNCSVIVSRPNKGPTVIDRLSAGAWFGEIALMQPIPRTATVKCETACTLITLTADKFHLFLNVAPELSDSFKSVVSHRTANVLRSLDLFQNIKENKPWSKLDMLATILQYEQCAAGQVVVSAGDVANKFYIIVRGRVRSITKDAEGNEKELAQMSTSGHFGEVALLRAKPHEATVIAMEPCIFMTLPKESFQRFIKLAPELLPVFQQVVNQRRHSPPAEAKSAADSAAAEDAEEEEPIDVGFGREESLSSMDITKRYVPPADPADADDK